MTSAPPPPPAGWYEDPGAPAAERYWGGSSWTSQTRPKQIAPVASPNPKRRIGCFGVTLILIVVLFGIIAIQKGIEGSLGRPSEYDATEKAMAVLAASYDESYTYAEVQEASDNALRSVGLVPSDETRKQAWSAVLKPLDDPAYYGVSPMWVMRCIAREGQAVRSQGGGFPEAAVICIAAAPY